MHSTYSNTRIAGLFATATSGKLVGIGLFVLLTLVYGLFFVRNFSGPLAEVLPGDTDQWEYMGYYVWENLTFSPLPHLNLANNQTFFPFGTNQAFQGWAFESNIWFGACFSRFGTGPWLNIYYLLSLLITSAGTYLLLRSEYGNRRAWLAGLMVSYLNFYALNKYPGHFAYSTIHWMVLSLLTDYLLVRRLLTSDFISLRLVLQKGLFLTLCLGLDVGYIMGYALSSFTLSVLFAAGLLMYRYYRQPADTSAYLYQTIRGWSKQWHLTESVILLLCLCLMLVYVPLVVDVARKAREITFINRFYGGHGWVHPLRLLLPYFPGFNAIYNLLAHQLHDTAEGYGGGSPGWLLLGLGAAGFWYTPRSIRRAYIPLAVLFVLYSYYHPIRLPTLQLFPWCHFYRHPARFTLVYPVMAAILALHLPGRLPRFAGLGLVCIGLVEISMVYQFRYHWKPYYYPPSFQSYMSRIRQQPGEAILDWPFCIVGGNGIGAVNGLCPLYLRTNMLYALKRFHGKKTVGQYFGRLHESQIQPFLTSGWPALLQPADQPDFMKASHLTTCFTAEQWVFFDRFYELNDFAGINLCVDLIPEACVKSFYSRYGQPVAATEVPGAGHVVFIPKPAHARARVNSREGKRVRFPCGCS